MYLAVVKVRARAWTVTRPVTVLAAVLTLVTLNRH
jgi:hypothetical protein